jgi:hypothetical protein
MTMLDKFFFSLTLLFFVPLAVVVMNVLYYKLVLLLVNKLHGRNLVQSEHEDVQTVASPTKAMRYQQVG